MKKVVLGGTGDAASQKKYLASPETKILAKYPNLLLHCAQCLYDDGSPRTPGWFTVKTMGGLWMIQIKEPDAAAQLTVSAQSFDDCLGAANTLLGSGDAPWQPDPFQMANKKKR